MEKIFLGILFLACLLLPVSPAISNILMLLFGGGIVILNSSKRNFPSKRNWLKIFILPSFFFIWMLIATLFSPFKREAFHLVEITIPFMVLSLGYIFSSDFIKDKAKGYASTGITFGVIGSLFFLFISFIFNFYNSDEVSLLRIFSHQYTYFNFTNPIKSHPTYYSIWVLLANFFVFNSKRLNVFMKGILLTLFFVGLVFTLSRVGLFLYVLQIISVFFYISKKWKIIYGMGMLGFLLIGIYLYKYQLSNFYLLQRLSIELAWDSNSENTGTEVNNRVPDDSRIARWSAIWETIKAKPILGYGAGSERAILDETYANHGLQISLERKYNTHNQYLFYLLEQGFMGLSLLLSYLWIIFATALKRRDMLTISFIIGIIAVFVFENYIYRSMGYLTIALFLTFMRSSKN